MSFRATAVVLALLAARSAPAAAPPLRTYRGLVSETAGIWQLAPCGAERSPIALGDATAGDLARTHRSLAASRATPVFMELRVTPGTSDHGPRVVAVRRAATEGHGCAETWDDSTFRARGNEPFWSLSARPSSLTIERPGEPPLALPATTPHTTGRTRVYDTGADGHRLVVRITEHRCVDGMSGERFPYAVELTLDGTTLAGCGTERPDAREPAPAAR